MKLDIGTRRVRLVASGLRLDVGDRRLLDGIDLEVDPGSIVAVSGPSGSGKTTLLMVLAGVLEPDDGSVTYLTEHGDAAPGRAAIGFVPQTLGLAPHLSAAENVAIPLEVRRAAPAVVRQSVEQALASVGLAAVGDRFVTELSGGQRQRVAIARALAAVPQVLVADEATAELDPENRELVLGLFQEQADRGTAVVVATHDPKVIEACSESHLLEDGRLLRQT